MNNNYRKLSTLLEFRRMSDRQRVDVLKRILKILKQKMDDELEKRDNVVTVKVKFLKSKIEKIDFKIKELEQKLQLVD